MPSYVKVLPSCSFIYSSCSDGLQDVPCNPKISEQKALSEEMIRDIIEGAGNTGICAGIIGELGMEWPTGDCEKLALRAAAIAQKQTGAPINIHLGRSPDSPFEVIEVLSGVSADISRMVLSEDNPVKMDCPSDAQRINQITALINDVFLIKYRYLQTCAVNTGSGAMVGRGMLTSSKTWCR